MSEPIASLKSILIEATKAARHYVDVNDACPYPFMSEAGRLYRNAFNAERNRLLMERAEQGVAA